MANTMSKYGSNTNRPLSEIVGLSTDTKPTDSIEGIQIQNGSSFRELDTGKRFLFDAENTTWNEVSSGGGGGGGSTLIEKSISANGVYNASADNADGYSKVSVEVATPTPETFAVELNVGWNTGQENVSFNSSKTLQEVISAHLSGKDVNFSVNFTYDGTLLTSNAATYLYIESGNMIVVLFSTLSGSTVITLPITWATDSNSGIMYNGSQIIYVIPN